MKKKFPENCKVVASIYETYDYEMFKLIKGNRDIKSPHFERLKKSIKERYLITPIIVNKNFEIIDGQHRFSIAMELKLPVYFFIVDEYNIDEVSILNCNVSPWGKEEHLDSYCKRGFPAYLQFKKFWETFPDFGIQAVERLLTSGFDAEYVDGGKIRTKSFENGNLKIQDYESAEQNAKKILMFKPYYTSFNKSGFVAAMIGIFRIEKYNHKQMMQRVAKRQAEMVPCATVAQYRQMLDKIYNYYRSPNERLDLR